MPRLQISEHLSLPSDFATKTAAILAQRRKGKTYTASVIAEEMVRVKQPFVALDPTGAWWGLRASADGKQPGLPVIILGGQHGDIQRLERTAGRIVADLVVDEPGYYVIDFSLFESGEAERQFAVDFAERLYRAKGQPGRDFPLHLFVDEADRFIPQQMRKGSGETSPRLLGAFEAIIRRGGLRGLGATLISQRAAVVNKNVLEMIDVLFALRTVGPNDRKAIAGYIDAHGSDAERQAMMTSLASLDLGEAWVWEPGGDPPLFQRLRIRARQTFNSSATPTGHKRVAPKRLAAVDLAALQQRMAETIEKAKADDPKELRKQIDGLKRELASRPTAAPTPRQKVVEKPIITDRQMDRIETMTKRLESLTVKGVALATQLRESLGVITSVPALLRQRVVAPEPPPIRGRLKPPPYDRAIDIGGPIHTVGGRIAISTSNGDAEVGKSGLRRMLIALAQRPSLTRRQLGVRAGVNHRTGTFAAYLSKARVNGWVAGDRDRLMITNEGRAALGDYEPLPSGRALVDYYLAQLGNSGAARMFQAIVEAYPGTLTRQQIADAVNLGERTGTFSAYLSKLRVLELVHGKSDIRASDELFD